MTSGDLSLTVVVSVIVLAIAAVRITRIITDNWRRPF